MLIAGSETIGARLSQAAARVPDRTAMVEREHRISFAQLDAAANNLARRLLATSDRRGGCVGLFFEDKIPAIASIFGAGKGGHPYVLLDAGDPAERLRFILEDSEPIALLTQGSLRDRAQALAPAGCPIIDVERLDRSEGKPAIPDVPPDSLVYLCYTSGSTGRPKGVGQTHRNLLFFADAYARALRIGETDRLSLLYTLSFNAANMDIFGGLLSGATLCAYDLHRDGLAQVADWLDRERVTVLHAVPTVFREIGNRIAPERVLPHLRVIDLGGESVFTRDVEMFRAHTLETCVLVNQLASTEVGLIAQNVVGHRDPLPPGSILPVGRCPDGVRVLIRREEGGEAAANEVGEMVVCSAHVSPGYWRRPELDAAVFSDDPDEPGWRRCASGDLGRYDEAGNLHFLGRKGSRVKIRGHSVDLMEVEAALSDRPGVSEAAVLARRGEGEADSVQLVAYVVAQASGGTSALLRRALAEHLPSYMLPSRFAYLDALPRTASGKIDRQALASVELPAPNALREIEPPRDGVEQAIATAFEDLLGIAPVGRGDDFFLLGGDSLLSVDLQARLHDAFGVYVGSFHETATVEGIAREIRRRTAESPTAGEPAPTLPVLIPLWRQGSALPLFLVHGRHGQAFVSPHFMRLLGDDQPVWAFQARGLDGVHPPHPTVEAMAADYLEAMRRVQPHGPYFLAALCAGAYIATAMARALQAAGETVLPLLLFDPPDRLLDEGYSQMTEEQFVAKMRKRKALGRSAGPAEDPAYMQAVIRVAKAFEDAIGRHQPLPYDGPVYMLSSRQRNQRTDPAEWRKVFTGKLKRFEVGSTHAEALDPRNPVFASCLLRCVGLIREGVRPASRAGAVLEARL